ncbi:extracellular solute-binding protein [Aliifodinibius sp. 1BSP15-2V2]|uniref:Extracellular solute-binding protein n=2 Tax=Fodinibius salsisoli TaxID=2820877 RepID=A0ABT3PH99_9BACT|nr:extracellular solute-binding protein [Fodinibius salsisoli]
MAVRIFEPFEVAIAEMWEQFCHHRGTDFELDIVPLELEDLHREAVAQEGLKNGSWDLALINTDWIAELYAKEAAKNLKPYIDRNPPIEFPDGWSESLLKMQQFGDDIIGLPFHDGPECLIYRTDLFEDPDEQQKFKEEYRKELKPPETWEDFVDIAHFFHRPEDNLYGSVWAAYPDGHNTVFDFALQVWTRGGELTNANGEVVLNTSAAVEGMEFYRKLLQDRQAVHPQCADFDSVKAGMAFARGEVAMMVNWFGFASLCEFHEESKTKGNVNITSIPRSSGGTKVSLNVYWLYVLGKGSQHKKIGYEFLRYAVTRGNDKLLTMKGGIGCRLSTWHDPEVNQEVPYYHRLEALHQNAKTLPRKTNWSAMAGVIDEAVLQTMNTSRPVRGILEEAQESISKISATQRS